MRYPASEKLEIIRLVEGSQLPTKRRLDKLGIPRATFHRWHDRYLSGGPETLEDRSPRPSWVWNRILLENSYLPGDLRQQIDVFIEHYNHRRYHESLQNLTPGGRPLRAQPNHRLCCANRLRVRLPLTPAKLILPAL